MKYIIETIENYTEGAGGTTSYSHYSFEIVEDIDLYLPDLKTSNEESHEFYVQNIYNCPENLDFTTLFNYDLTFDDFITLNKQSSRLSNIIISDKKYYTAEELSMKLKDCCPEITKNKISFIITDDYNVSSYLICVIERKLNLKSVSKDLLKNLDKENYSKRFEDYVYQYKLEDFKEYLKMCDDKTLRIQDILQAVYNPFTVSLFPQYDIYRKFNIEERMKRFTHLTK